MRRARERSSKRPVTRLARRDAFRSFQQSPLKSTSHPQPAHVILLPLYFFTSYNDIPASVHTRHIMPQSLAGVKAEIKTWERAFRAKHDRNPTRDDIKARRDIGTILPGIENEIINGRLNSGQVYPLQETCQSGSWGGSRNQGRRKSRGFGQRAPTG